MIWKFKKKGKDRRILLLIPIGVIFLLILLLLIKEPHHVLTFQTFQQKHELLRNYANTHPFLSALIYIGIYVVSVTLVIPDSTLLCIIAGFLFPLPLALLYALFSETTGAILFFLASQTACKGIIGKKHFQFLNRLRVKFHSHEISYLLFLRFSHLMPFWMINLFAGVLKVELKVFAWTTLVGVLPLTCLLVLGGSGLSKMLATNTHLSMGAFFNTQMKISLVALGLLALLPLLFRRKKK